MTVHNLEQLVFAWAECIRIIQNILELDRNMPTTKEETAVWIQKRDDMVIKLGQLIDDTTAYVNEIVGDSM